MTAEAPRPPSAGWKVLYEDAFARFASNPSNLEDAGAVADFIVECRDHGPPSEGVDGGDDVHLSRVPGTRLVAEYLVIESEFLIVFKDFR